MLRSGKACKEELLLERQTHLNRPLKAVELEIRKQQHVRNITRICTAKNAT